MKVCSIEKVARLRKETDIMMEKEALNKLGSKYKGEDMPSVKLIGTFREGGQLYFIMEYFYKGDEVWEACRTFGLVGFEQCRRTFLEICKSVKKVHDCKIIHRDLKVRLKS